MAFGRKHFRRFISGKKWLQPLFKKLHSLSLMGLNFGGGDNVASSGEKNAISYLRRHTIRGTIPVVFDIGANAGLYTAEVLKDFGDKVEIHAFEPLKEAFAALSANMKHHTNVRAYNFGFGESERETSIYSNNPSSPLASCFNRRVAHLGIEMKYSETIELKRLDIFCSKHGIRQIDLLKIDVEGGELAVLKGTGSLLASGAIRLIQFEFGACNIDSRTFFKDFFYLLNPHYRIYRILKDGLEPVDKYTEACEVFLTTNYLAISRTYHE